MSKQISRKVGDSLYRVVKCHDEPGYYIKEIYNHNRAETFATGASRKVYATPEEAGKVIEKLPENAYTRRLWGREEIPEDR